MKYRIELTPEATTDLANLDRFIARRIKSKLEFFQKQENPLWFAKRLQGAPLYRFRVGNYRVIFEVNNQGIIIVLLVLFIRHRREAYH